MSNSDDVLIKVENVSKKFCRSLKRSMLYGMEDISRDLLHLPNNSYKLRQDEFWAIDDVSFEVKRGECLGIIGRNGAGKSTLLKMLNGIILPDKGKITIKGKVGALIEVGAGFHPMLTGRENVYVNGAILGMSKREIDSKFDEIVAFAELEEFIDMPVKHYSSGMYVRLGFAIAAQMEPDILILDEMLAVGDAAFRAKCYRYLSKSKKASAIILVSHDLRDISRHCNSAVLINRGRMLQYGNTEQAINQYTSIISKHEKNKKNTYTNGIVKIKQLRISNNSTLTPQFSDVNFISEVFSYQRVSCIANFTLFRSDGVQCYGILSSQKNKIFTLTKGRNELILKIEECQLMPGSYFASLYLWDIDTITLFSSIENATKLVIIGNTATTGVYTPKHSWHQTSIYEN